MTWGDLNNVLLGIQAVWNQYGLLGVYPDDIHRRSARQYRERDSKGRLNAEVTNNSVFISV